MIAQPHILKVSDDLSDGKSVSKKETAKRFQLFSKKGLTKDKTDVIIYRSFKRGHA